MYRITLLFVLAIAGTTIQAQKYTTAAGIRVGGGIGITVQQLLWDKNTLEAQVQKGFTNNLTLATLLFEQHHGVFSKGTNFYIGAGPHFGHYGSNGKNANAGGVFGASFIGGLELKLGKTLLSFDLKPMLNLAGGSSFFDSQAGVSLRYVFLKAPKKEHKWMFWKKGGNKKEDN
jgi:hypothetical protein